MLKTVIENGSYVVLKLSTGEDVLGKLTGSSGATVVLNKPRTINVQQMPNGQVGMSLIPYMQLSTDIEVTFASEHVIVIANMSSDIKAEYLRVASGIVTAMPSDAKFKI